MIGSTHVRKIQRFNRKFFRGVKRIYYSFEKTQIDLQFCIVFSSTYHAMALCLLKVLQTLKFKEHHLCYIGDIEVFTSIRLLFKRLLKINL